MPAYLRSPLALVPYVPFVPRTLVPHVPHALLAGVPLVPCALRVLLSQMSCATRTVMPHLTCVFRALSPICPHDLWALFSYVPLVPRTLFTNIKVLIGKCTNMKV